MQIFKFARNRFLVLSWALYDLANQFFALNVVSLYFPRWLSLEKKVPEIFYSISFGLSMFLVAISAPFFGAVSDIRGGHRAFLVYFTLLSIIFTMALGFTASIIFALIFFAIANFGCQGAIVFYNALMVKVAPQERMGFVSGLGRMFGYTGAILALYLTKPVVLKFGYKSTFILTGILFLLFSLPCMLFVKEGKAKEKIGSIHFFKFDSFKSIELKNFLKAAFFGLCAINVILLFMSVYVSKVFGLTESEIINLIAFSTIFAILGSIVSGFISDYVGPRRALIGTFFLWGVSLLAGALLSSSFRFLIGALAGMSLGATWVIARAFVIKLTPQDRIGEAFGLFNMVGYLSGIVGPFFWGVAVLHLSSFGEWGYRIALLSLTLFMAIGFVFLARLEKV